MASSCGTEDFTDLIRNSTIAMSHPWAIQYVEEYLAQFRKSIEVAIAKCAAGMTWGVSIRSNPETSISLMREVGGPEQLLCMVIADVINIKLDKRN
jgi:hypothetical protein